MRPMTYSSNILFDFETLLDIDMAIIRYFKHNFSDTSYIDRDILSNTDEKFYHALLLQRKDKNPLSIILKEQYLDSEDGLYNELIETKLDEILPLTSKLSLFNVLVNATKSKLIKATVLCKNESEEQFIKKLIPDIYTIRKSSSAFDLDFYNCIYIKDIDFLLDYTDLRAKDVYILAYGFNLEANTSDMFKLKTFGKLSLSLKLHLVVPYVGYIEPI